MFKMKTIFYLATLAIFIALCKGDNYTCLNQCAEDNTWPKCPGIPRCTCLINTWECCYVNNCLNGANMAWFQTQCSNWRCSNCPPNADFEKNTTKT